MAVYTGDGTLGFLKDHLGSSSMNTCIHTNHYPSRSAPTNVSAIVNDKFFSINLGRNNSNGTIGVHSGYTTSTGQSAISLRNINITENGNITVRAVSSYPVTIDGWYTATTGGTQLVAGGNVTTLDITFTATTFTSNTVAYARFSSGVSVSAIDLGYGSTSAQACAASANGYYTTGDASNWYLNNDLYTDSNGTNIASSGYYSDEEKVAYWNSSTRSFSSVSLCSGGDL